MSYESLHRASYTYFSGLEDKRASNSSTRLSDYFMSGLAMFQLKYPSMFAFSNKTKAENANTRRLFHIKTIPSDAALRQTLDQYAPNVISPLIEQFVKRLESGGKLDNFRVFGEYYLVPMDGVEFFSSKKIHCPYCQCKTLVNAQTQYSHSMLCCVIVKPGISQVVPLGAEAINKQDGESKNDHELCAAKRLWADLWLRYPTYKFLHGGDALFANAPLIRLIEEAKQKYIFSVKPDSHKALFDHLNHPQNKYAYQSLSWGENGEQIMAKWYNNLPLNNTAADVRTNFFVVTISDKKGKTTTFSWITNLKITPKNIKSLVMCARGRWKIENETFNTLKNQDYNFEHNYGHGKQHLSNLLAMLMLLAFLIDQIQHIVSRSFKKALTLTKTKVRLWEEIRAVFRFFHVDSFNILFNILIANHSKSGP